MTPQHLIVFVKNPIPGQVKTRIGRVVGHDTAVAVYRHLIAYTQQLVRTFAADNPAGQIAVYYGDFINPDDGWNGRADTRKHLQTGNPAVTNDLGYRMLTAFREQFDAGQRSAGAGRVVIIGSDCLDLTTDHLEQAFTALETVDVVMGPATDGGYYLLGMNQLQPALFADDMPWSQPTLCERTKAVLHQNELTHILLDELADIDEWSDYEQHPARQL